jgi:methane monooxygenase component A gamma chain
MGRERSPQLRKAGAACQSEFPPYGDQRFRREWASRVAAFNRLDEAVTTLLAFRREYMTGPIRNGDALWIEARLEERAAVLRFQERSNEDIRARTLTGEFVGEVCAVFEMRAAVAVDAGELERTASEFRLRYKPPIMPSAAYLRTEVLLGERLMIRRSLGWFDTSLAELRRGRGVVVRKEGLTDPDRAPFEYGETSTNDS